MTARTLWGRASCPSVSLAVQRPVLASWKMSPDSDRLRSTSATKKGLPSVSR